MEQLNIAKGAQWGFRQKRREFLDERFVCDLHKRTLGEVWNGRADIGPQSGTSASPPGESPQTFAGCSTTPVCGWNRWYSDPMNWQCTFITAWYPSTRSPTETVGTLDSWPICW